MTVKIVTDSVSDITPEIAKDLDITVVPLYVRFGDMVYRDRVEMGTEEFYQRLVSSETLPSTTQPTPNDFATVYTKLGKESQDILVVVLSKKLSGTYESALAGKKMVDNKLRITVIDSEQAGMGLGVIAIAAAKAARKGANLDELDRLAHRAMLSSHPVWLFDTLKYLAKGGRIGKAQGLLGSLLSIKPILTVQDGEVSPVTRLRSRSAGLDYLFEAVANCPKIEELAVEYATTPDDAEKLIDRISKIYPKERIYRSTVSPVLGVYAGPGAITVTVLEAEK